MIVTVISGEPLMTIRIYPPRRARAPRVNDGRRHILGRMDLIAALAASSMAAIWSRAAAKPAAVSGGPC